MAPAKKPSAIRIRKSTVISSATTLFKLLENVSDIANFPPLNGVAKILLQILETMKEVNDNDEKRLALMKDAVDYLVLLREHLERNVLFTSPILTEKLREFELILQKILEDLKLTETQSYLKRAITKNKIRSNLDAHSENLRTAIEKLNFGLNLGTNAVTQTMFHRQNERVNFCGSFFFFDRRQPD